MTINMIHKHKYKQFSSCWGWIEIHIDKKSRNPKNQILMDKQSLSIVFQSNAHRVIFVEHLLSE